MRCVDQRICEVMMMLMLILKQTHTSAVATATLLSRLCVSRATSTGNKMKIWKPTCKTILVISSYIHMKLKRRC